MKKNQTGFNLDYEIMECGNCGCRAFTMTRWRDTDSRVRGHVWNTEYNCMECGEKSVTNNKNLEGSYNKLERVSVSKTEINLFEMCEIGDGDDESSLLLNWPQLTRTVRRLIKAKDIISRMHQAAEDRLLATLE